MKCFTIGYCVYILIGIILAYVTNGNRKWQEAVQDSFCGIWLMGFIIYSGAFLYMLIGG